MKKTNNRIQRINDEILMEVANIIRSEIKDPRVSDVMVSVIRVDTTSDLKYCKIFVSVLGTDKVKEDVLDGLKKSAGYIRRELAHRINLRATPELKFLLDESLEYSIKMEGLMKQVREGYAENGEQ